jgi:hypothetical protein
LRRRQVSSDMASRPSRSVRHRQCGPRTDPTADGASETRINPGKMQARTSVAGSPPRSDEFSIQAPVSSTRKDPRSGWPDGGARPDRRIRSPSASSSTENSASPVATAACSAGGPSSTAVGPAARWTADRPAPDAASSRANPASQRSRREVRIDSSNASPIRRRPVRSVGRSATRWCRRNRTSSIWRRRCASRAPGWRSSRDHTPDPG